MVRIPVFPHELPPLISSWSGAETDGPPVKAPVGARFRRQSLQVATKLVKAHTERPSVQSVPSAALVEKSPAPNSVCYDRSASPILMANDDDDERGAPRASPHEGVLGIILDLYKLQNKHVLEANLPDSVDPTQMVNHPRSWSSGSKASSSPVLERRQAFLEDSSSSSTQAGDPSSDSAGLAFTSNTSDATEGPKDRTSRVCRRKQRGHPSKDRPFWPEDEEAVTKIAEAISSHITRQMYLIKLCRALMTFGAPTHRLEAQVRPMST